MFNSKGKKRCCIGIGTLILCLFLAGCSLLPPKKSQPVESGLMELEQYAWDCYGRGRDFMQEGRYEMARQQFAFAAAAAVSETLYEDAVDGIRRVDRILIERR